MKKIMKQLQKLANEQKKANEAKIISHIHTSNGFKCLVNHPDHIQCDQCNCGEFFRA